MLPSAGHTEEPPRPMHPETSLLESQLSQHQQGAPIVAGEVGAPGHTPDNQVSPGPRGGSLSTMTGAMPTCPRQARGVRDKDPRLPPSPQLNTQLPHSPAVLRGQGLSGGPSAGQPRSPSRVPRAHRVSCPGAQLRLWTHQGQEFARRPRSPRGREPRPLPSPPSYL